MSQRTFKPVYIPTTVHESKEQSTINSNKYNKNLTHRMASPSNHNNYNGLHRTTPKNSAIEIQPSPLNNPAKNNGNLDVRGLNKPSAFFRSFTKLFSQPNPSDNSLPSMLLLFFALLVSLATCFALIIVANDNGFFSSVSVPVIIANRFSANGAVSLFSIIHPMVPESLSTDNAIYSIQYNAIQSWLNQFNANQIHLYVDNAATCHHLYTLFPGINCYEITAKNSQYNRPYINSVFNQMLDSTNPNQILIYLNGDIVIDETLAATINTVQSNAEVQSKVNNNWVMVAQRTDLDIPNTLLFNYKSKQTLANIVQLAERAGKLHGEYGIDFIAFPQSVYLSKQLDSNFPDFLAGVYRWDNWLLSEFIIDSSINVIDVTETTHIIHQNNIDSNNPGKSLHQSRAGAVYNDNLVKKTSANNFMLGKVTNADYKLHSACSADKKGACKLELLINEAAAPEVLFARYANPDKYLAVLTVNSGYLPLAWEWVCSSARINFTNFLLLAEDMKSYREFKEAGIDNVWVPWGSPEQKEDADYGSVAFQTTMTFRTEFLMKVLQAGYHVMTADMDGLWLADPFQFMNNDWDLQGQTHKKTKLSGGLIIVRSTPAGIYFWQSVIDCQRFNAKFLAATPEGQYEPSKYTEQYCINELSRVMAKPNSQVSFKYGLLNEYLFPDGRGFFDLMQTQLEAEVPVIIHNNWIVSVKNKLQRLIDWKFSAYDHSNKKCVQSYIDSALVGPLAADRSLASLTIKVLSTGTKASQLQGLLDSLQNSMYDHTAVINLDILIDGGQNEESVAIAKRTQWKFGKLNVFVSEKQQGVNALLINNKLYSDTSKDNDLVLVLEEDLVISPHFYSYLKALLDKYYLDPSQFDARLYGISLQSADVKVLGESLTNKFGSIEINQVLHESKKFQQAYKYQLPGQYANLFFPKAWRSFIKYLNDNQFNVDTGLPANADSKFSPCVPTLISNKWFNENPAGLHWQQWFARFAFDNAVYSLYLHLPNNKHLAVKQEQAALLLTEQDRGFFKALPAQRDLLLFDFHFHSIKTSDTLQYRAAIYNPLYFDQCYTIENFTPYSAVVENEFKTRDAAAKVAEKLAAEAAKKSDTVEKPKIKVKAEKIAAVDKYIAESLGIPLERHLADRAEAEKIAKAAQVAAAAQTQPAAASVAATTTQTKPADPVKKV
jgi:hypothetical protein